MNPPSLFKSPWAVVNALLKGDNSYSDGRHDFDFEVFVNAAAKLGIEIDYDAIYRENSRRWAARDKRRELRAPDAKPYRTMVLYCWEPAGADYALEAAFGDDADLEELDRQLPSFGITNDYELMDEVTDKGCIRTVKFDAYNSRNRSQAAAIIRYYRAVYRNKVIVSLISRN